MHRSVATKEGSVINECILGDPRIYPNGHYEEERKKGMYCLVQEVKDAGYPEEIL